MIYRLPIQLQSQLLATIRHSFRYTRQYLQNQNIDHKAIQQEKQDSIKNQFENTLFNLVSNEKNPANHIKVKIHKPTQLLTLEAPKKCQIMEPEPKPPKIFVSAIRKYIITSIKKSKIALFNIRKLHILDAINQLQNSHKKVAKLMIPTLYNLINHAKIRGINPLRLFIHGAIIGKTRRFKGLRYHARGKSGRMKKDLCQIKIVAYQKDQKSFYGDIAIGKCPPSVATVLRQKLIHRGANLKDLINYVGITTAKGRQQARQIFKRKVYHVMKQSQKAGEFIPKKIIERQIKYDTALTIKDLFINLSKEQDDSLRKRQILFKKNKSEQN